MHCCTAELVFLTGLILQMRKLRHMGERLFAKDICKLGPRMWKGAKPSKGKVRQKEPGLYRPTMLIPPKPT